MRPPVSPGHDEAGKRKKHKTSDTGASSGAGSVMWPFTFCEFCWVESPFHLCSHSGTGVTAVTHFPNIFNHLYGPCLTSAPRLMSCHCCDWPPCAISKTEYRLNLSVYVGWGRLWWCLDLGKWRRALITCLHIWTYPGSLVYFLCMKRKDLKLFVERQSHILLDLYPQCFQTLYWWASGFLLTVLLNSSRVLNTCQ